MYAMSLAKEMLQIRYSRVGDGSVGHGSWVTWVAIIRWVMGQWVLTHDPSFFSIFGTYVLQTGRRRPTVTF